MRSVQPHPPERRLEILRLLRETDLPISAIGARMGVSPRTIYRWNALAGWPRPPGARRIPVKRWPEGRRAALVRLLNAPGTDPGDVAEALGLGRLTPEIVARVFGRALRRPPALLEGPDRSAAADPSMLRTQLRAHIVRQIAAFDAALSAEGIALRESARVLRDLGGLKRLLDAVEAGDARRASEEGGDGGAELDLPALRAAIARRYAGFVGGRAAF